jgi:UDP-3-O-[3-hydroxymyristoyl] glucosamine N-acyltransferase
VPAIRLSELCSVLKEQGFPAQLEGPDCEVTAVNTLEDAQPGELTFLSNPKYAAQVATTQASAVILAAGVDVPAGKAAVRCAEPYAALTVSIITIHGYRQHPQWGISPQASVDASAELGEGVNLAPHATVAAGAKLGARCTLYPGAYVGEGARLGDDCVLFPNAVVYDHCVLGNRVTLHAGSVVGQDGLGYAPIGEKWLKIPQAGRAVLEDDVEIGANCAIDRATLGRTVIGAGTKFGNVCVVGHGTKIGPDCLFVGLVGLAGSVNVGRHVTLAGQVGVNGHITIADNATVAAKSGVSADIAEGETVFGYPATQLTEAKRAMIHTRKLPDLFQRIKDLEQQTAILRAQLDALTNPDDEQGD